MWEEDFQAGQSIDMSRGIVESEKGEFYSEHSLEREEGPALALVAALLEWSEDEDEWHCRPPKKVYTRGSGIKEAVGKAKKGGVARQRVPKSSRMYEDETVWGGELSEVKGDCIDVFETEITSRVFTPAPSLEELASPRSMNLHCMFAY
ncbi:hypothetical protein NDU88_004269 [Pleurodeles waltl]|uniref:Uncharacterized protein n=1 Tax=Pleurodeles waltl TaxID=8319 RepID=A0AAV7RJU6_PLEWA|nr:hypothetical protein NDU88_004269 [Pleurodeles waltl]